MIWRQTSISSGCFVSGVPTGLVEKGALRPPAPGSIDVRRTQPRYEPSSDVVTRLRLGLRGSRKAVSVWRAGVLRVQAGTWRAKAHSLSSFQSIPDLSLSQTPEMATCASASAEASVASGTCDGLFRQTPKRPIHILSCGSHCQCPRGLRNRLIPCLGDTLGGRNLLGAGPVFGVLNNAARFSSHLVRNRTTTDRQKTTIVFSTPPLCLVNRGTIH